MVDLISLESSELSECAKSTDYMDSLEKWENYSSVWANDTFLFYHFVCKKIRYDWTKQQCESTEAGWVLGLGVCGFIGALLSLLTFSRRPFVAADVYLYRTVGVFECVHMAVMTLMHVTSYYDCDSSYFCTFFSAHIYMTASNLCAEAVEFIVVFLCIERTIACLTPQYFYRIHRIGAYRMATLLALITSLPLNIIHSFDIKIESERDELGNSRYHESPSFFASTRFYDAVINAQLFRFCLVAPLLIVSTAGSIVGLWKAVKRKRRLRGDFATVEPDKSPSGVRQIVELKQDGETARIHSSNRLWVPGARLSNTAEERTRKEIKQMVDLCCLQLCLAIPIVINYLLCLAERAIKLNIAIAERHKIYEEAFGNMTYEEACEMIDRATALEYLRFAISITHMMAHGLHFYLYISFSAKFRQALCVWLRLDFVHSAITKSVGIGNTDRRVSNKSDIGGAGDYLPIPSSSAVPQSTSSSNQRRSCCDGCVTSQK